MIETFDDNTQTTQSEHYQPPLGLVPFDLIDRVIYRDGHREVHRQGPRTAGGAFSIYDPRDHRGPAKLVLTLGTCVAPIPASIENADRVDTGPNDGYGCPCHQPQDITTCDGSPA